MKNKVKKDLVATLADENYIEQAKQLFSSVYCNAGWQGDFILLSHAIPEKKLEWFRDKGILIKKCKPLLNLEISTCSHFSKLYLFATEFKKWKNIIFLDADIIVRASLDKLLEIKGIAAVKDIQQNLKGEFIKITKKNKFLFKELKKDYNLKEKAFNTGLMAFSTDIIKKDTFLKLKRLLEEYNSVLDQPILNLFFYKKWIELPLIYNFSPYNTTFPFFNKNKTKVKGIILHFWGALKPWNKKSPFYKEWKKNFKKAELINLKNPPEGKKLTDKEIKKYSRMLKMKLVFYSPFIQIDRILGLVGDFLKPPKPFLFL